jgi:conjugal transfer pilus assembly protein TraF
MRPGFALVLGCLVAILAVDTAVAREDAPGKPTHAQPKPYLQDRERGWFWYEDPVKALPAMPPEKPAPAASPVAPAKPAEVQMYERFKANMEEARIVALFNPTAANVERYVQYRTALVQLANQLADAGQRVVWANPQYDLMQERPPSPVGIRAYDAKKAEIRRQTTERLAKSHVLYFFFKSDCPYCHAFAPILRGFSMATGIEVFPVSLDGGGLAEYPRPHRDQGQAAALGATTVPAVFLANPKTREIVPVAFGLQSDTELMDRIVAIANPGANEFVDLATPTRSLDAMEGLTP